MRLPSLEPMGVCPIPKDTDAFGGKIFTFSKTMPLNMPAHEGPLFKRKLTVRALTEVRPRDRLV